MSLFRKQREPVEPRPFWPEDEPWHPGPPPSGPVEFGPAGIIDHAEQARERRQAAIDEEHCQRRRDEERAEAEAAAREARPVDDGTGFANL